MAKKKRANGEGSLRKRKDGRWEGRYTAGNDPATGKPIHKSVLAKTQSEAKEKLKQAIAEAEKLDMSRAKSYTLGAWIKLWYEVYAEPRLREKTKDYYLNYIDNHIVPELGNTPLEKLTTIQIQKFYNDLQKSGRIQRYTHIKLKDKGLSTRVVRGIHTLLNNCLEQAVAERLILANPAKGCRLPKLEKREMKILPEDKIGPYLVEAERRGLLAAFYLELTTGLRRGELLALLWTDLDAENMTISVSKQVNRVNGELVVSQPKTPNSIRKLAIPQRAVELLVEEHGKHPHSPYLFVSPKTGTMFDPDSFRHTHEKILKAIGAEHIRFHDLRHPYVKHTTKIFSLRLMDFQAQAYPDARRKTRGACQLHRGGQSQSPVRPLCNRKRFSCLPPQSKMSWILYAISMRLSGYTSTRSINSSASSVVSVSASKIALDASLRLSCRACSSCFCFACANTAA